MVCIAIKCLLCLTQSQSRTLRRGKHRLLLWSGIEADGSVESTTPSKIPGSTDEMGRLEKLVKKYERGDLAKSEWLDKLIFRKMEEIHAVRRLYLSPLPITNLIHRLKPRNPKTYTFTSTSRDSTFL